MAGSVVGQVVAGGVSEQEFRDWVADGYGTAALFVGAVLLVIVLVLRATRSKY